MITYQELPKKSRAQRGSGRTVLRTHPNGAVISIGKTPVEQSKPVGKSAPLGTNCEISPHQPLEPIYDDSKYRHLERYSLQSAARSVLDTERVSKCLRVPTNSHSVDIHKTISTETFHYQNLQTCGSVWHCPCCAAKISEKRQKEVLHAITSHEKTGGQVLLLTLTLPHRLNQSLKTVLETLLMAHAAFERDREYRNGFKVTSGLVGRIRSLEVTYGENGWHPHLHLLLFVNQMTNIAQSLADLFPIWKKVVVNQGFSEPNHHGLTLENGDKAAKYVGKWGLEHEMTKSHIKRSKSGYTPFDLLRVLVGTYTGTAQSVDVFDAAILFNEYGKTFKGRRQLVWSNGLRDRFNLGEEKTDEELSNQVDEKTVLFAKLPLNAWKLILKNDHRGEVLKICSQGLAAMENYIITLFENNGEFGET